ncbi:hypothetical protein QAD02_010917 [Eretmocerus hayati]|uniref:Uncharacterized protein n=1 Tax=Eretmocerus hayati TaxID=131215 RepID=A0ACC2NX04_9HYME|nr:hypothetical protein QAD02_010917 [Eretmocerus hayati]
MSQPGGFPGSALVTQLIRQFTKPLSQRVVRYAARRPLFQRYFLIAPGRAYHRLEASIEKLKSPTVLVTTPQARKIPTISEKEAVQIGSQLMVEVVIFALLVAVTIAEWFRSQLKSERKEERHRAEFQELEKSKLEAEQKLEKIQAEIEILRAAKAELMKEVAEDEAYEIEEMERQRRLERED